MGFYQVRICGYDQREHKPVHGAACVIVCLRIEGETVNWAIFWYMHGEQRYWLCCTFWIVLLLVLSCVGIRASFCTSTTAVLFWHLTNFFPCATYFRSRWSCWWLVTRTPKFADYRLLFNLHKNWGVAPGFWSWTGYRIHLCQEKKRRRLRK